MPVHVSAWRQLALELGCWRDLGLDGALLGSAPEIFPKNVGFVHSTTSQAIEDTPDVLTAFPEGQAEGRR